MFFKKTKEKLQEELAGKQAKLSFMEDLVKRKGSITGFETEKMCELNEAVAKLNFRIDKLEKNK